MLNDVGVDVRVGDCHGTLLTEYCKGRPVPPCDSHIVVPTGGVFTITVRLTPEFTWESADALRVILEMDDTTDYAYGYFGESSRLLRSFDQAVSLPHWKDQWLSLTLYDVNASCRVCWSPKSQNLVNDVVTAPHHRGPGNAC